MSMSRLQRNLALAAMAHRYLYYVKNQPVISDQEYDKLEERVRKFAPPDHPIHKVGSDQDSSYDDTVKLLAKDLSEQ